MRQTKENCWEEVLTEEERELINEFLETWVAIKYAFVMSQIITKTEHCDYRVVLWLPRNFCHLSTFVSFFYICVIFLHLCHLSNLSTSVSPLYIYVSFLHCCHHSTLMKQNQEGFA